MKKISRFISSFNIILLLCHSPAVAQTIHFEVLTVNGKSIHAPVLSIDTLILDSEKSLTIQVIHPKNDTILHQYNFGGINEEWITYQSSANIYYYEIPGGKYPFTVRRKNNPNIHKTISINVRPQLWQLWWFLPSIYFFISLIIGSAFYFVFRCRFERKSNRFERL